MNSVDRLISTCRHCRFYTLEGRRGGQCKLLDVNVQGSWTACALAASPFSTPWQELEHLITLEAPIDLQEVELAELDASL